MMNGFNWAVFGVLVGAGAVGAVAIMPYAFALNRKRLAEAPLPERTMKIMQFAQAVILTAIVSGLGLLLGEEIGLGAPVLAALLAGETVAGLPGMLALAIVLGLGAGAIIAALQRLLTERFALGLKTDDVPIPGWQRFIAGFYGGINEEILMRLGVLTGFAWLLSRVFPGPEGALAVGVFWAANVLAALLFGAGHLGAASSLTRLTPGVIGLVLLLNGIGGLVFGWLYWQHGLLAAMLAHFSADVVLHVIAPHFTGAYGVGRAEPEERAQAA
ncbi:MAG: CPBP family intramembrane metalloprotease [Anaerolineae bacterium]|nr:CPBP family intramembrane metalloprotease [Anaerolineae bacterium]